jgi:hypothetical protein
MGDFALKVTKGSQVHQIENLKSTSTKMEMVWQIKRKFRVCNYGAFSLQNRLGEVFYIDEENNDFNSEMSETMENFFGNPNGGEIIYDPINAGKFLGTASNKYFVIWNALAKPVRCRLEYKIDNAFVLEKNDETTIGGNGGPTGGGGNVVVRRNTKQERVGSNSKPVHFDIASRDCEKFLFEDLAIAECTIIMINEAPYQPHPAAATQTGEDQRGLPQFPEVGFSARPGKSVMIFKHDNDDNDPPIFVSATTTYCRDLKKFDWKTELGKDLSKGEKPLPKI